MISANIQTEKIELKPVRQTKRDIHGWLPVDKPTGITSADVVNKLKRLLCVRKAGHAGTLDKPATGVLAVAFGNATKTIPFVMDSKKTYVFRVKFGESTTTDDATGEVIHTSPLRPTNQEIKSALEQFRGQILQTPPNFSAVKIGGKRAAVHAIAGDNKKLAARSLDVHQLEMTSRESQDVASFIMECGKGGYVRSIARDLGQKLNCYGHVLTLRRIIAGPFQLEQCVNFPMANTIIKEMQLLQFMVVPEIGLRGLKEVPCTVKDVQRIQFGNPVQVNHSVSQSENYVWASFNGRAVAIGIVMRGFFHPKRVFNFDLTNVSHINP